MTTDNLEICVVGAGPRGLSVLERLCANERRSRSYAEVTIHVVDSASAGPGAVWRTDQSRLLLTNTVASQITVFTDDSAQIDGPIEPGPSLYDWAKSLALLGEPENYDREILAEARAMGPNSYPSRAFYGHYLQDVFQRIVAGAPHHVTVRVHRSRAVAIADTHGFAGGPQGVRLANGTRLDHLDAVVLAQGHVPARLSSHEARTASLARIHHLNYVTPANPADVDLSAIQPNQAVLMRGLGLNFFDYMALLTIGRGGEFVREDDRLVYKPSGREPKLYASSRRGVPYHARGENEKGAFGRHTPQVLTPARIAGLHEKAVTGGGVRFDTDVWPLIAREVEGVYYRTLLESRGLGVAGRNLHDDYLSFPIGHDPGELLDLYRVHQDDRWDWERVSSPYLGRRFSSRSDYREWILEYLARDVRHAQTGNVSDPVKAALDVLRDLRNEIRQVVDHGGLAGDSHRDHLEGWYTPLNAFLSIGPPASRIEQMIALIEGGVLELLGPGTRFRIDISTPVFVAESNLVPGDPIRATTLIEARLPEPDLRRTDDPLLRHMLDTDQCSPYRIPGAEGTNYETGGLAVTARPYHVVDAAGKAHHRRFAYGVPTESVHWVTAAGIRPGVDSVTLGDSDAIARAILHLRPVSQAEPLDLFDGADEIDVYTNGVIV
ncbi:FAD/NAD(P)-binding domain-containing protein [Kutzneria buriramensis]|uniref:FAD-NAD(P)-binding protein n=1 Tax=Kutzneria buriramensis TaxID=1045776 RepID=A0A3E0GVA6_9PSEU|nr:FAD/NAD(P)-binding protein [Kutzneria buriramensis]REH29635.1 FAD-NAD(P)-binding protein [Kutzneria buriramensis]